LAASRELLPGALVLLAGLAVAGATFGITRALGVALALLGLALLWVGWQRRRFGRGVGGGVGVVQVDERRLAYWGPLSGGVIDMDDLARLDLDPTGRPAHWILWGPGGQRLAVPVDALGAERLLDLFAALPGLSVERLVAAREAPGDALATLWSRSAHLSVVR